MKPGWVFLLAMSAFGQQNDVCPRPEPGDVVRQPPELRSSGGVLHAGFVLRSTIGVNGVRRYCYLYGGAGESPTLRVHPGDELVLTLKNELPAPANTDPSSAAHNHGTAGLDACGHGAITDATSNVHFHGMNVPPTCHQDDVLRTWIQPGDAPFEYRIRIPASQPPGLYWYHPHPHGFSRVQVQGGASGALIVEGIEKTNSAAAGLPERILVLRDQPLDGSGEAAEGKAGEGEARWKPALDVSLNYVPVVYANQKPAIILVQPSKKELWRVLNASSGTFFDLRLLSWPPQSREVPLPVNVLAVDGVPAGPAYAAVARDSVLVPPGGRVEFVVTTPPAGMHAQLVTNEYDNGPSGDRTPYRVLANLRSSNESPAMPSLPGRISPPASPGFQSLESLVPVRQRMLYFSETPTDPAHPKADASYFVTIDGAKPKVFDMKSPTPSITATQGTVEDWTIENRASESHVFHIHQLHFQLLERDGKPCAEDVLRDTIELPYWDGKSAYPKIKIRMDFRDPAIVGIFPYHCHILEHEDGGMMGLIEIVRPPSKVNRK